jgi:hypothetical protein
MDQRKSFEEHLHYVREMCKLKLWFVWTWLKQHPEETFEQVLRCRTNMYGLTAFGRGKGRATEAEYADPAWRALLEPAKEAYEAARQDADASRFERDAFAIFRAAIEAEACVSYAAGPPGRGWPCGSLSFDPPRPDHPATIHFHIANAVQPRSIFDDRDYLPKCFFCIMDTAERDHGADTLMTGTWLNSLPRWLELFPQEYRDHMGPEERDIRWGGGFWGQFINARGCFNEKYARIFRGTGLMPYARRTSWCSFKSMREHLVKYLVAGQL